MRTFTLLPFERICVEEIVRLRRQAAQTAHRRAEAEREAARPRDVMGNYADEPPRAKRSPGD